MARTVTLLPSVILMSDGREKELDLYSPDERKNWNNKIYRQIGVSISEQYTGKISEWNDFAVKFAQ